MKRLFFVSILMSTLAFASSNTTAYLTKQEFLYKMNNYSVQPGYNHFLETLSDKRFTVTSKTLVPVELSSAHTSNQEFVRLPKYAQNISLYMGVWQKANDKAMSKHYQCSELVHRFYKKVFSISSKVVQRNGVVTAKEYNDVVGTYDGRLIKIIYYPLTHAELVVKPQASLALSKIDDIYRVGNDYVYDTSFNDTFEKNPPTNGSILSFANNFHSKHGIYFGHTAIVKKVVKIKNGYRVYCFEQNVIKSKDDTISLNRYITFIKKKGHWQEMGSGILGDKIGRIGPVIGWSKPYFIKDVYVTDRSNFQTLITKLIDSKYLNLTKYKENIIKPISQNASSDEYVTNSLYNAVMHQIVLANTLKHESFFHKLLRKLGI